MMLPVTQPTWPFTFESARVGDNSVKFPCFISGVGTVEFTVVNLRLENFCASKKKKVRFLIIGPPIVPPYWF